MQDQKIAAIQEELRKEKKENEGLHKRVQDLEKVEINQQETSQRIMKLEAKLSEQQEKYERQIKELNEQLEPIPE